MHTLPLHVTEPPPPICTSHPVLTSAQEGRGVGVALVGAGTELAGAGGKNHIQGISIHFLWHISVGSSLSLGTHNSEATRYSLELNL
jgi:hypothetical protein